MSAADPIGLLDQARVARAEAARSRRLANEQADDHIRITLTRFANEKEAHAAALEQQAFNLAPRAQRQAIPAQMQQSQITPAKEDDQK